MRQEAKGKYGEAVNEIENQTQGDKTDEVEKTIDPELIEARIELTDRLLDKMLANDPDLETQKILPKFQDLWHSFDEALSEHTIKY